jgi:hypothetical protein
MMWPRLSKEFSKVAQLQAVSHSRGYAATGSGEILPPTQVGRIICITPRRSERSWRRTGPDLGEALAKGSIGGSLVRERGDSGGALVVLHTE